MNRDWKETLLGDVIKLEYGKPLPANYRDNKGQFPVYGANGIKDFTNKYFYDQKTIIVGRKGSAGEITLSENKFWPLDVTYFVTFNHERYNLFFLYYLLKFLNLKSLAKGTKPGINRNDVYAIKVRIPPLAEQQRIVALLDQALSAIETAIDNATNNLSKLSSLFDSCLIYFLNDRKYTFVEKNLVNICTLQRGYDLPKQNRISGKFPIVSSSGVIDTHNEFMVKGPCVVTGRSGSIGSVFFVEEDFWPLNTVLYVKNFHGNFEKFVYYILKNFDLKKYSSGTGVPTLNRNFIHDVLVRIPQDYEDQKIIANRLDMVTVGLEKVRKNIKKRIHLYYELKQAILHKAFNGEL